MWGGCQRECFYTVRNTVGRRAHTSYRKGGSVTKKTHELVYYESIKREVKTEPMYECRCDVLVCRLCGGSGTGWPLVDFLFSMNQ